MSKTQSMASAAAAVVLAALYTAAGTFQTFSPEESQSDQVSAYVFVVVIFLAAAAIVYAVVLPRTKNVARTALILGILAVLSLPAFWLGLMPVLGVAALALGWQARRQDAARGLATAGLVLGALAVLAGALLAVTG